ncbi:MAG: DUF2283 domain-containing protein [Gammaproteobacteria bacterium]|nr:DUF2283 domain-containing protein [Gammaproteobacteria bacterium]
MKITYFEDTDTALVELSSTPVVETRELSEDVYLDLDASESVVAITIEHASTRGDMSELSFCRLPRRLANHELHPTEARPAP